MARSAGIQSAPSSADTKRAPASRTKPTHLNSTHARLRSLRRLFKCGPTEQPRHTDMSARHVGERREERGSGKMSR